MQTRSVSVTQALIIVNVLVFALCLLGKQEFFFNLCAYTWVDAVEHAQVWRFVTYQFLHANMMHILFNMWALYFFGPPVENFFGPRRYLAFYLLCGVAGALFSSLLAGLGWYSTGISLGDAGMWTMPWEYVPLVGASAAIYGVMVAVAFLYPRVEISLLFPPITLSMRSFALLVMGIAVATVLFNWSNAGGEAGHLGGILMGAGIMLALKWRGRLDD